MTTDPLAWLDDEAAARAAKGLTRRLRPHGPVTPGRFEHDGRTVLNFGSNDYLGLAADPRLAAASAEAAARFGSGSGASALVSGWCTTHQQLAKELARFERSESVAIFPSGFAANLGAVVALVGQGDAVYADRLDHACLIDGARLSGASLRVYPHADAARLGSILARERDRYRRVLIATDGVFSMDGDLAPLAELAGLAERFDVMLLVDEAHGTGVFGPDGRGASSALGVADRVHVRVGTLSKALGSLGGFVAGSARLVDHLINHARTLIYSTALPPPAAASALAALEIVQAEPWRRAHVFETADRLRAGLRVIDGLTVPESVGPIVPLIVGEPERAVSLSARLLDRGLFAPAIRPPTVPAGTSRLRLSVTAAHAGADVDALIQAVRESV
ncbi:MAG: 8-amino-7-oxononanoate synthase [Isosphaeraceae bacterium]